MMVLFHIKINATVKYVIFYFSQASLFFASTPITFWTPTVRGRHIVSNKARRKNLPVSCSIVGHKDVNGRKSRLSKLLSFVPNQRLSYKLVDNIDSNVNEEALT